jgi:phenylalanyl-tRNA synthetase alpha chain
VLGRISTFGQLQRGLGSLAEEQRRSVGAQVNAVRAALTEALDARRVVLQGEAEASLLDADRVDLTLPGRRPRPGSLHPLSLVERDVIEVFTRMGFRVAEGPEIEDDWHNFQALNIPQDHPARTMKDSLYVAIPGHPELLLRTETSSVQIRTMQSQPPPVYVIAPGRVYRRETPDPTHLPVFHQVEALVVDEGITFADLKGSLEAMVRQMFGDRRQVRLGPAYFPFVEPGAEVDMQCSFCAGSGCRICKQTGWVEIGGAGMVDPDVFKNCGIDSERYTGFAFGMGLERMAMLRHNVNDIKFYYEGDIRFLEQF